MMTDEEQLTFAELGHFTYEQRVRQVLRGGAAHCRSKGRHHAVCVRVPGHDGTCEGPGFDEWGPMYVGWTRSGAGPGIPLPPERRLS